MPYARPPKDVDRLLFQRGSDGFGMTDFFHSIVDPQAGVFRPARMQPYINRQPRPEVKSPAKMLDGALGADGLEEAREEGLDEAVSEAESVGLGAVEAAAEVGTGGLDPPPMAKLPLLKEARPSAKPELWSGSRP